MAKISFKKKDGTAVVTQEAVDHGKVIASETKQEVVASPGNPPIVSEQLCEVGVDMGYTHNLGDYKSARVAVSLKIPCAYGEIEEVFEYASKWVGGKMEKMVGELVSQ